MELERKDKALKEEKKENILSNTINIPKQEESKKICLIAITIFLVIYSFLYGLWRIPIVDFGINRESSIGFFDYLFVIAVSALISVFLALFLHERRNKIVSASS